MKVKEADKVNFPDAVNLPHYKMKILQIILAASGRRDVKNVTKWVSGGMPVRRASR